MPFTNRVFDRCADGKIVKLVNFRDYWPDVFVAAENRKKGTLHVALSSCQFLVGMAVRVGIRRRPGYAPSLRSGVADDT